MPRRPVSSIRYNRIVPFPTSLRTICILAFVLSACLPADLTDRADLPTARVIPAETLLAGSLEPIETGQMSEQALPAIQEYKVPAGAHPHDVAPAVDGGVWYTAQHQGALGYLDPATGETHQIPLG